MNPVKVLFIGDSITDCNRARPVGEWLGGIGDSYVGNLLALLWANNPQCKIRLLNTAISGNTSNSIIARFDTDAIDIKPDYIYIMIGVNDCWRHFDQPLNLSGQVSAERYRENIVGMIEKSKAAGITVVLMTPFFLETNRNDSFRRECDIRNDILRDISKEYGLELIDVQAVFDKYLSECCSSYLLSGDRVHPNSIGRAIIAKTVFDSPTMTKLRELK